MSSVDTVTFKARSGLLRMFSPLIDDPSPLRGFEPRGSGLITCQSSHRLIHSDKRRYPSSNTRAASGQPRKVCPPPHPPQPVHRHRCAVGPMPALLLSRPSDPPPRLPHNRPPPHHPPHCHQGHPGSEDSRIRQGKLALRKSWGCSRREIIDAILASGEHITNSNEFT